MRFFFYSFMVKSPMTNYENIIKNKYNFSKEIDRIHFIHCHVND